MAFRTDALNAKLIESSKPSTTEWVVITGAPSSGKSSVISKLKELGFQCNPEVARVIVEAKPKLRDDESNFQRIVTSAKHDLELSLDPKQLTFLDRGMPDSISYYRKAGLDPNEALKFCSNFTYKKVFIFERLDLVEDGVRIESNEEAEMIQSWLKNDYEALGYEPIVVKKDSIAIRTRFILQKLGVSTNG